eukprot:m.176913 g.176913  ORF g.176913 m.176913 type:complete len:53 (-) comp16566_c1_seq6:1562-1720(-)
MSCVLFDLYNLSSAQLKTNKQKACPSEKTTTKKKETNKNKKTEQFLVVSNKL